MTQKGKVVAKMQHFYEILLQTSEQNETRAIVENSPDVKKIAALLASEYSLLANQYNEMFKEYIYTEEKRDA